MKEQPYFVKCKGCVEDENSRERPEGMKNTEEDLKRFH